VDKPSEDKQQTLRPKKLLWFVAIVLLLALIGIGYISWHERLIQKAWDHRPKPSVVTPGYYKITYVYDGDTFAVDMNGTPEKVRLIGIDTPETHKPDTPLQCYGTEASNYAKQLETGKNVRLESDPTNSNRDRYGRLLRYAYLEQGDFINKEMIERGLAFAYTPFAFEKKTEFLAAEKIAKDANLGLWAACQVRLEKGVYQTNAAN
jgi:micrococcal nuclease